MLCPSTTVPIIKITLPLPQSDSIHPTAVLLQGLGPNPGKEDERTQHGQGNFKELSWGRHSPDGFSRFVIKLQQLRPCGFNAETGKQTREMRTQTRRPTAPQRLRLTHVGHGTLPTRPVTRPETHRGISASRHIRNINFTMKDPNVKSEP